MFINLCCQGGFGHHGSQHGTLALDILRERRLTHLVAGGSICFPFFGQVSLPIVHWNRQIIAEGLGVFVSHTQKKLQLSGNTGKRETQIPNPLRGNRAMAITKEYKENFLMNLSNLLQSKVNHQEKQDTHTHTQQIRKFTEEDTTHTMILFHPPITSTFSILLPQTRLVFGTRGSFHIKSWSRLWCLWHLGGAVAQNDSHGDVQVSWQSIGDVLVNMEIWGFTRQNISDISWIEWMTIMNYEY